MVDGGEALIGLVGAHGDAFAKLREADGRSSQLVPVLHRRPCRRASPPTTKQASECGKSKAKKWILRSTPPMMPMASPKSASESDSPISF
jgi:hypothetical protein